MTFEEWAERLYAIYREGSANNWAEATKTAWDHGWAEMEREFPHISLTWMDPDCGCCELEDPALLAFDDPRGPGWFEALYPVFKPTHVYQLG